MKTLVVILQYNTHELTDSLYQTLKPYEEDVYDLVIIDNGSDKEKISQYATYALEENGYYGGGLNAALGLIMESPQYDSIMVLNNDILCHGKDYVKTLRQEMFDNDLMIISPCVLEPHTGDRGQDDPRRHLARAGRHPRDRRPLAQCRRPWRSRVPQPRRRLLPALRWAALQRQARRRHRRRQLRRGSRDRPRRRGRPCDRGRVR